LPGSEGTSEHALTPSAKATDMKTPAPSEWFGIPTPP
jgi:hypothetical protein